MFQLFFRAGISKHVLKKHEKQKELVNSDSGLSQAATLPLKANSGKKKLLTSQ